MIDTLAYVKHLEQAGVNRQQAEAHAEALNQHVAPELATRQDIVALKQDLTSVERSLKQEIVSVERSLKQDIAVLKQELLVEMHRVEIRALTIIATMLGLAVALIKLIP